MTTTHADPVAPLQALRVLIPAEEAQLDQAQYQLQIHAANVRGRPSQRVPCLNTSDSRQSRKRGLDNTGYHKEYLLPSSFQLLSGKTIGDTNVNR